MGCGFDAGADCVETSRLGLGLMFCTLGATKARANCYLMAIVIIGPCATYGSWLLFGVSGCGFCSWCRRRVNRKWRRRCMAIDEGAADLFGCRFWGGLNAESLTFSSEVFGVLSAGILRTDI